MRRVEVWSDIHCPWALVALHRLRQARARLGAEVVFVPRAWPLEWVNGRGTPLDIVSVEVAALAWRGGLVRINSTDPGEPGRLLSNSIADPAVGSPAA